MSTKRRVLLLLVLLALFDTVIPIPLTTLTLVYVLLARPPWFPALVRDLYAA